MRGKPDEGSGWAAASSDVPIAKGDAVIAKTTYRDWLAR
jgi:hypothetical protein